MCVLLMNGMCAWLVKVLEEVYFTKSRFLVVDEGWCVCDGTFVVGEILKGEMGPILANQMTVMCSTIPLHHLRYRILLRMGLRVSLMSGRGWYHVSCSSILTCSNKLWIIILFNHRIYYFSVFITSFHLVYQIGSILFLYPTPNNYCTFANSWLSVVLPLSRWKMVNYISS